MPRKSTHVLHLGEDGFYRDLGYNRQSHAPVRQKMPENLPRWNWPALPALRVTPVKHLNVAQCEALLVHHHGGTLTARRRWAYWAKVCRARGIEP